MGYSLEVAKKDLQVDQCKRDLSTLSDHRSINSYKALGYWKESFPYSPFIRLILFGGSSPVRSAIIIV